ncbi:DUF2975 domain-containing protein [Alkalihalobacterium bogoriense]|uniref:DUF2975 domain-containing protein n=1 Tax=Alkalihalobacterium bogoriense TaxID=246272 RepID=UPI00047A6572|nr:DUF2975 domain-containing protein [Alkalihalobacterium bogoriense]
MERQRTLFLKIVIILLGITVVALCVLWLPWLARNAAEQAPEFAYLKYPVLLGLYVTAVPFFMALHQAWQLLNYIEKNAAFSELSVSTLNKIKYCGNAIAFLYAVGTILLLTQNALHPGVAIISFLVMFTSVVIAVFAAVLQKLLKNALKIKSENELTI